MKFLPTSIQKLFSDMKITQPLNNSKPVFSDVNNICLWDSTSFSSSGKTLFDTNYFMPKQTSKNQIFNIFSLNNKTPFVQTTQLPTIDYINSMLNNKTLPTIQALPTFQAVQKDEATPEKEESKPFNLNVNGELDEVIKQGGSGDCWIIASLISLNSTAIGKEIIKNSISTDKNGDIEVTFDGVNQTYTVTKDEILKYDTDSNLADAFCNGDNDALAIEIAVAKLRIDLANNKVKTPYNYNNGANDYSELSNAIDWGYSDYMTYYLTGKAPSIISSSKLNSEEKIYATLSNILQAGIVDNMAMVCSLGSGLNKADCINSNDGFSLTVPNNDAHSLSVTELTQDTITLVNPWNSAIKYVMTWEEFAKLNVVEFSYVSLS